jgi:hypothetical protein
LNQAIDAPHASRPPNPNRHQPDQLSRGELLGTVALFLLLGRGLFGLCWRSAVLLLLVVGSVRSLRWASMLILPLGMCVLVLRNGPISWRCYVLLGTCITRSCLGRSRLRCTRLTCF